MILILSLLFATPPTKRVEYAHVRAARDSALVIYAIEEVDHKPGDFEHHVFVALVRHGREIDRDDVTADLMAVDDNTFMIGLGARVHVLQTVYLVGEFTPRVSGYRPGVNQGSFAIEKRAGGHVFQLNFSNSLGTTIAQTARGATNYSDWFMGFNISRKF